MPSAWRVAQAARRPGPPPVPVTLTDAAQQPVPRRVPGRRTPQQAAATAASACGLGLREATVRRWRGRRGAPPAGAAAGRLAAAPQPLAAGKPARSHGARARTSGLARAAAAATAPAPAAPAAPRRALRPAARPAAAPPSSAPVPAPPTPPAGTAWSTSWTASAPPRWGAAPPPPRALRGTSACKASPASASAASAGRRCWAAPASRPSALTRPDSAPGAPKWRSGPAASGPSGGAGVRLCRLLQPHHGPPAAGPIKPKRWPHARTTHCRQAVLASEGRPPFGSADCASVASSTSY